MTKTAVEVQVDELERRIAVVCGHLNVCHGQLLDLVVEVLATNGWHGWGFRSPEHWVSLRTGFSPARSRGIVHLARRAGELPVTVEAVRSGRLSIDQAVVVGWTVPAHNDREACDLALSMSVSQLRHSLGRYQHQPPFPPKPAEPADEPGDEPGDEPAGAQPAEDRDTPQPVPPDPRLADGELSFGVGDDGRFWLRLDAPIDDGQIIDSAFREARDALCRAGHTEVSWLDAFNEICRRSLASNQVAGVGVARSDRYRIYIHLDTDGAWVNGTTRVPQNLLDQILCDGVIRPVWTTNGKPVNVGRATRTISPELRRLVLHRDGHRCRTPGCDNTLGLEIHHILWFDRDHGPTETWNLGAQCGGCHHHIHRGHINVSGNADEPDGLIYTDEHDRPLIRYPTPIVPTRPPPQPALPYQHPLGERVDPRWIWLRPPPPPAASSPPDAHPDAA